MTTANRELDEDSAVPYDRGWSWMVVLGISLMHIFLIGYIKTFGILFVELQERFQLTSVQTAWVSSAMLLTIDILSPLGTALGDHLGSRCVVMLGGAVVCTALALASLLTNIQYMIAVMGVLFGIGATLCYAPSMIMVGYYFKRRLALANAFAVAGSSVGQFILPPIVTILLDIYSFDGTLMILAAIMFNLTLAGALLRPVTYYVKPVPDVVVTEEEDVSANEKPLKSRDATVANEAGGALYDENSCCLLPSDDEYKQLSVPITESADQRPLSDAGDVRLSESLNRTLIFMGSTDLRCSVNTMVSFVAVVPKPKRKNFCCSLLTSIFDVSLLKNPVYVIFALGCCAASFSYIGVFRYLPAHCKDLGIDNHERALLLSVVGVVDLVSRILVGVISDTVFMRQRFKRYRLLAVALILSALNAWLLIYSRQFWTILISCIFYGILGGVHMTLLSVTLIDLLGAQNLSRAWGIMLLMYSATTLGEPLVLSYLRDVTGSYDAAFITCAALFLAGGLLILVAPVAGRGSRCLR